MKNLTLTLSNLCGKINKLFHQIYYESHTQTDLLTTNLNTKSTIIIIMKVVEAHTNLVTKWQTNKEYFQ